MPHSVAKKKKPLSVFCEVKIFVHLPSSQLFHLSSLVSPTTTPITGSILPFCICQQKQNTCPPCAWAGTGVQHGPCPWGLQSRTTQGNVKLQLGRVAGGMREHSGTERAGQGPGRQGDSGEPRQALRRGPAVWKTELWLRPEWAWGQVTRPRRCSRQLLKAATAGHARRARPEVSAWRATPVHESCGGRGQGRHQGRL